MSRLARKASRVALLSASALAGVVLIPGGASAGEFPVVQCGGAGSWFDGQYSRLTGVNRVNVLSGCRSAAEDRVGVYQDRRGGSFSEAEGGHYQWRAPAGLSVVGLNVRAKLKDANGLRAAITGRAGGSDLDLDAGLPHDGSVVEARWSNRSRPLDSFSVRLRCNRAAGCPNRPDSVKSFFEVMAVEFQVADSRAPSIDGSGELVGAAAGGRWIGGSVDYSVAASDVGAGLSNLTTKVNGFPVQVAAPACAGVSGTRALAFSPCPPAATRTARLDTTTAPFQEGPNRIETCASDYAGAGRQPNTTCTPPVTVMVDNREPPPPVDLRTDTDGSWSPTPDVSVRWDSTGDAGSGIASVRWNLVRASRGHQVAAGSIAGSARSTTIRVPEPGEYLLETRFADHAGNVGSPAVARVRFDDIAPPPASPAVPDDWLSRDELPLPARVEPVEAAGPSGILGYALAVSDEGPLAPCRSSICERSEVTILDRPGVVPAPVAGLREGVNWLTSVAVSGASVPSRSPMATRVLVDRTDPNVTLNGAPTGWSREPVSLVANSTDALSGMEADPDDDGRPVTVIEVEGGERVETEGDRAEVAIEREGVTEVRFFGRDLAGNVNDGRLGPGGERHAPPGIERVMVDRTPPEAFHTGPFDPENPSLVQFDLVDRLSGVDSGKVLITPVSNPGQAVEIESRLVDSTLEAEVPSDDLPPGEYDVSARATDRAGNRGTSESVRVVLPLKVPVSVSLGYRKAGQKALTGKVQIGGGRPGRQLDLVVEETYVQPGGGEPRLSEVRTEPDGTFRVPVAPGPRRSVRVLFPGTRTESRAASQPVQVVDRDRVSFETTTRRLRNRQVLKMKGRVEGPGLGSAHDGKGVVIQYFDPARRRWRPVEVVYCDSRGRFGLEYRFTTITSPQRILFRAQSLGEAAWPFRPSASREVSVVVRP